MHRTLLLVACLVGAVAFFANAPPRPAQASPSGPSSIGGAHPWLDFTGTAAPFTTTTVYTVPAGRVFIVTGLCATVGTSGNTSNHVDLLEDSTDKYLGDTQAHSCTTTPYGLGLGKGHIPFAAGADVVIKHWPTSVNDPDANYYIEGYLAAP